MIRSLWSKVTKKNKISSTSTSKKHKNGNQETVTLAAQTNKPETTTTTKAAATVKASYDGNNDGIVPLWWCIQIQSEPKSLEHLPNVMACITELDLHVIDHYIRGGGLQNDDNQKQSNVAVLTNELYCKDKQSPNTNSFSPTWVEHRIEQIRLSLEQTIEQPPHTIASKVHVQRWYPPVQKNDEKSEIVDTGMTTTNEKNQQPTTTSTTTDGDQNQQSQSQPPRRRLRRKMKSTPRNMTFGSSDMFGVGASSLAKNGQWYRAKIVLRADDDDGESQDDDDGYNVLISKDVFNELRQTNPPSGKCRDMSVLSTYIQPDIEKGDVRMRHQRRRKTKSVSTSSLFSDTTANRGCRHKAELITVQLKNDYDSDDDDGELGVYKVLLSDDVVNALKTGFSGEMLHSCRGLSVLCSYIQPDLEYGCRGRKYQQL